MFEKKKRKKKGKKKFKLSGHHKEGQNNNVLEKLRNQEKEVPVNSPILI